MSHVYCDNMPTTSNVSMNQFTSNNLRSHSNKNTDVFELMLGVIVFLTVMASFVIALMDKIDKKPVLPFTTHDTCTSTSISLSPTYGKTLRRVSSSDPIIGTV
jgi:hypothetical protein